VGKDVEEHQDTKIVCLQVQGVGSFAQRYRVDQPKTQMKRKGNSGDDLHRTAGPSLRYWEGGSEPAAQPPPQRGAFAQHEACIRQDKARLGQRSIFFSFWGFGS
jgi:hypothetical protein